MLGENYFCADRWPMPVILVLRKQEDHEGDNRWGNEVGPLLTSIRKRERKRKRKGEKKTRKKIREWKGKKR